MQTCARRKLGRNVSPLDNEAHLIAIHSRMEDEYRRNIMQISRKRTSSNNSGSHDALDQVLNQTECMYHIPGA